MVRTCVVNCNSLLAIDVATYLVMRFCRRDGATSPVVNLAALLWWRKYRQGGMSAFMVAEVRERGPVSREDAFRLSGLADRGP